MMTREQFSKQFAVLTEIYRTKIVSSLMVEAYYAAVQDIPDAVWRATVMDVLKAHKYMPTPSEIRDMAGRGAKATEQDCALAWGAVRRAMDEHDYTTSVDFGPLVNHVLRNMGTWPELCDASVPDLVWKRKQFEELYSTFVGASSAVLRGEPLRGVFAGPPVRIAIGGVVPPRQIAGPIDGDVRGIISDLAEEKS